MTRHRRLKRRANGRIQPTEGAPKVGLFGLMGQGNLGNDGSLEAVLAFLRAQHPDLLLDALCTGPDVVTAQCGIPAAHLRWYHPARRSASGPTAAARRAADTALGVTVDAIRIASWVRRHDAVIVPGMGVLETTVPMRAWKTPYWKFVLCASGRVFGTKVALVCTGANFIDERVIRVLIVGAARLACYRSFRDEFSRDSMRRMGLDTSDDAVYPDVVFSLPTPGTALSNKRCVGIGVMDYCGTNIDRRQADGIRSSYIDKITSFALWLVDNGRSIRLITSDPAADAKIIRAIVASLRAQRPRLDPSRVIAEPIGSIGDLMRQIALVDTVVATRYHSILCALKLAKPTVSLGYATKCDVLMAEMGLSRFCQPVKAFDVERLIEQFEELDSCSAELRLTLAERTAQQESLVGQQFAELSETLFPTADASRSKAGPRPVRLGVA